MSYSPVDPLSLKAISSLYTAEPIPTHWLRGLNAMTLLAALEQAGAANPFMKE